MLLIQQRLLNIQHPSIPLLIVNLHAIGTDLDVDIRKAQHCCAFLNSFVYCWVNSKRMNFEEPSVHYISFSSRHQCWCRYQVDTSTTPSIIWSSIAQFIDLLDNFQCKKLVISSKTKIRDNVEHIRQKLWLSQWCVFIHFFDEEMSRSIQEFCINLIRHLEKTPFDVDTSLKMEKNQSRDWQESERRDSCISKWVLWYIF